MAAASPQPIPSTTFRFKSSADPHSHPPISKSHRRHHPHHRRHHHHHHHHHHRRTHQPPSSSSSQPYLDPDTAFRESLFDALADDEGAQFWEGVYGQPIHTYARPVVRVSSPSTGGTDGKQRTGETGKEVGEENEEEEVEGNIQTMTDEEYISYVRRKMWEKSHGYIYEERAKREAERKRRKREDEERRKRRRVYIEDGEGWESRWRSSGAKAKNAGMEKKEHKGWERYLEKWEDFVRTTSSLQKAAPSTAANDDSPPTQTEDPSSSSLPTTTSAQQRQHQHQQQEQQQRRQKQIRNIIPWPTLSGRYKDLSRENIESFFKRRISNNHDNLSNDNDDSAIALHNTQILKIERIRWHPDKMQQRFGGGGGGGSNDLTGGPGDGGVGKGLDKETIKMITMVFQVIDELYGKLKLKYT